MSTMKKRIPMFLLALAMMVAMAVPAFADGIATRASTGSSVTYCAYGGTNEMSTVGPSANARWCRSQTCNSFHFNHA